MTHSLPPASPACAPASAASSSSSGLAPSSLTCLILAAGKGTRMKTALPKPMHPVAGRPMILYALEAAQSLTPQTCVVVIGPGMEALAAAVTPVPVAVQAEPRGTGDAVRAGYAVAGGGSTDVLVLFGDTPLVTPATLRALMDRRRAADSPAVVVAGMTPPDPTGYGRLIIEDGLLQRIIEHRDATEAEREGLRLCNGGLMLFDGALLPELLDSLTPSNARGEYYLTDAVAAARQRQRVCAFVEIPYEDVLGVNTRAELAAVERVMQRRLRTRALDAGATLTDPETVTFSWDTRLGEDVTVGPYVVFGPGVRVADGVEIKAFSHLEGARVETGCGIGPFARLRPGTSVGPRSFIGNFVELNATEVGEGVKALHLTYLGNATVGSGSNIGAGTITCNYDGFVKSPTRIGAGAFIGSNSALVAPVTIGDGALVGAGSVITEDVPPNALALERSPLRILDDKGMMTRRTKG